MSSTCSVLPRDLVSVEVAAEQVGAHPQTLLTRPHDSAALTDACTRKGPQMANPRPTPKPENLRPPWPPGTSGNPAGYSRGKGGNSGVGASFGEADDHDDAAHGRCRGDGK